MGYLFMEFSTACSMKRDTFTVPLGLAPEFIIDDLGGEARVLISPLRKFFYGPSDSARIFCLAVMQAHNGLAFLEVICLIRLFKGVDKAADLHLKSRKPKADRHASPPKNSHGKR